MCITVKNNAQPRVEHKEQILAWFCLALSLFKVSEVSASKKWE